MFYTQNIKNYTKFIVFFLTRYFRLSYLQLFFNAMNMLIYS